LLVIEECLRDYSLWRPVLLMGWKWFQNVAGLLPEPYLYPLGLYNVVA